jgi:AcrR family transcriptional regulator
MSTPSSDTAPEVRRAPDPEPEAAAGPPAGNGRPRDPRIDEAVLQATADLLEEVGYLQLTIAAIAERAGTTKPALYRRWPTKAHLVHEAVFPVQAPSGLPDSGDLSTDVRMLVAVGVDLLARPAARAALPGLMAEMSGDPALHADILGRFADGSWGWLQRRLERAIDSGEARADLAASRVLELIAGSTLIATMIRPHDELDAAWIDQTADIIMRGITP